MEPVNVLKILLYCLMVTAVNSETAHPQECVKKTYCEYANHPEIFKVICNSTKPKLVPEMLSCFNFAKEHKTINKISLSFPTSVVLKQGMFEEIPDFVFQRLSSLEDLFLKHCSISKIHQKAFYGLQSLVILELPENNLTAVPTESLKYLPHLRGLDLSYNQISELGRNAFRNLSIYKLYLSGNRLSSISRMSFLGPTELKMLYLDRNNISFLHKDAFAGLNMLKILDLAENNLATVPTEAIRNLSKLKWLHLRKNSIAELIPNAFAGLRKLNFSDNGTNLRNETIFGFRSLYSLEISYNKITELKNDTFRGLPSAQLELNLTHNHILMVQTQAFAGIKGSLKYLFLQGNQLARVPVEALQNMTRLEHLSVGSFIEYIEADTFKTFGEKIKIISLQGNKIKSFARSAFYHLPKLQELYLGNNQIHHLEFYLFQHFINDVWYLDIKGNPLKCDCELYWYTVVNWRLEPENKDIHIFYNATLGVCPQENVTYLEQECKQKWKPILCNATSLYDCMYVDFCLKDPACCDQETYDETKVCIKI